MDTAIEVEALSVHFGSREVIEDFSFAVPQGSKTVLSGESGCGKSTLLRCILGFVVPRTGAVRVSGEVLTENSVWRLRGRVGYVQQEPEFGSGSVSEVLKRPFAYRQNASLVQNLSRVEQLCDELQLSQKLLDADVRTLSGGEKQRLSVVQAALLERPIMLLDEPFSALDEASRGALTGFLSNLGDITVLCVSHEAAAMGFSDTVIKMPALKDKG